VFGNAFTLSYGAMASPLFDILCIVRNGANTLPRLFKSLKEFQSRGGLVIVVDTGSSDDSPEVARSFGAEVTEVGERFMRTIDPVRADEINDQFVVGDEAPIVQAGSRLFHFANARNFAASLAHQDWVCWVDSDEAFVTLDIDKINAVIADPEVVHLEYSFCYAWKQQMNVGDPGYPGESAVEFIQSKMYRRCGEPGKRMRWRGIVHEVVEVY